MTSQLLLVILLLFSGVYIYVLCGEKENLNRELNQYAALSSQEGYREKLEDEILSKHNQVTYLEKQYEGFLRSIDSVKGKLGILEEGLKFEDEIANKHNQVVYLEEQYENFLRKINEIKKELGSYEENLELQSFGFYEPKYNFIHSDDYIYQLKSIKLQQKQMISGDVAIACSTGWVVGESKKEGDKLVKNFKKLILTIFNTECDEIIQKVKPGKVEVSQSKVESKFKSLNRSAKVIRCNIADDYLILKIRELHLQYELECKRQEEKEIAQQIKQEDQDRRKIEKSELEAREAEERELKYKQEIDKIRRSSNEKNEDLILEIEKLEQLVREAQSDREAAESRSRMIKSGHIFVISNIGSLGRDVYRICSTKSVNEDIYISNMTPIVPFPFDIHFKFFSEDVSGTLKALHERFQHQRLNTINPRRDFFKVSFDEIKSAIGKIRRETGTLKNFTIEEKAPVAYEFRKTQQQSKIPMQEQSA